jgi:hypothetical protein
VGDTFIFCDVAREWKSVDLVLASVARLLAKADQHAAKRAKP